MGLDQYLFKTKRNDSDWNKRTYIGKKQIDDEEIYYWRKANQIRKWFVNNCGYPSDCNCEPFRLFKEDFEKIIKDCKFILENKDKAKDIMPTQSGFFFGSTEYDEYYFEDIENTLETFEKLISEIDFENETVFYYEWW